MARLVLLLLCAVALATSSASALPLSTGILTGRVLDVEGKPFIGATVRLKDTKIGGLTKAPDGRFTIAGIRAGDYTVEIRALGYSSVERKVRIEVDRTIDLGAISLSGMVTNSSAVIVQADRSIERETVTTTRSITTDEPRSVSRREKPVNSVALQPAARDDSRGQNGIAMRGGRSTDTKVRVDGVEVSDPYSGGYGSTSSSSYPSVDAQAGAVAPNPVSAEYGEALGAAVQSTSGATTPPVSAHVAATTPVAPPKGDKLNLNGTFASVLPTEPSTTAATTATPKDVVSGESYSTIYENAFLAAHVSPISTFSIDVDRASYSNVRRFLNAGQRPPADAVRIEELVNYFDYDYADPADAHPFAINTELSDCPWDRTHRLVRVGLQGKRMANDVLPPSNLTFLIDVSGSMSGQMQMLKEGFKLLVDQLRPEDNVAIVVYAGAAGLVLPMTSGRDKGTILGALNGLQSGGSTAGGAGIQLAYKVARESFRKSGSNRVILATDGDFNVGVSSEGELVKLIEERRKDGVFLSVLGFGTGNYQDSKMEQLADKGNGNYAYIDNLDEAKKVFVDELGATLVAIAKDVKIQVLFSPERVASYRLIGYENRMLATEDFDDDLKDAGELGAGHAVTALYEIVPRGSESSDLDGWVGRKDTLDLPEDWKRGEMMRIRLRYKLPDSDVSSLIEGPVIDRGIGIARSSEDFRFAAAVAQFGLLLRDSKHKGSASYDDVLRLATGAKGKDANGYRAEFIALVNRARGVPTASR